MTEPRDTVKSTAGAVDLNIRKCSVIRRRGSLQRWGPTVKSVGLSWETGDLMRKQGEEVWLFPSMSRVNMDLWDDEDV